MWLLVGLGNPGAEYQDTRHNVGFWVLDRLLGARADQGWRRQGRSLVRSLRRCGEQLLLVKPQTYMNRSGVAVRALAEGHDVGPQHWIVAHDDLDLPLGTLRLKRGGGSGGHRGLESICEETGSSDFVRLRLGIEPEDDRGDAAEFVLSRFDDEEQELVESMVERAARAVDDILTRGLSRAMTEYNKRG